MDVEGLQRLWRQSLLIVNVAQGVIAEGGFFESEEMVVVCRAFHRL